MSNVYHAQKIAILANTIDNYVDGKIDAIEEYTLPVAGASTLGGLKVGDGLAMDGDTLNVTFADDRTVDALLDSIFGAQGGISNG